MMLKIPNIDTLLRPFIDPGGTIKSLPCSSLFSPPPPASAGTSSGGVSGVGSGTGSLGVGSGSGARFFGQACFVDQWKT